MKHTLMTVAVGLLLSGCCARLARDKSYQDQDKSYRALRSTTDRIVSKVVLIHTGTPQDRLALEVKESEDLHYQAAFGGTQGGLDPTQSAELHLTQGWVYIQGEFKSLGVWRVPTIITQSIGIGADGTGFLVRKDTPDIDSEHLVACDDGEISIQDRLNFSTPRITVTAGEFVRVKYQNGAVRELHRAPTSSDTTVQELIQKGKMFANEVQTD
jgi:hypothetical protein